MLTENYAQKKRDLEKKEPNPKTATKIETWEAKRAMYDSLHEDLLKSVAFLEGECDGEGVQGLIKQELAQYRADQVKNARRLVDVVNITGAHAIPKQQTKRPAPPPMPT